MEFLKYKTNLKVILPAVLLTFSACSTDFETIADYKEIMVVYGLMNQYNGDQYIKVNKAYLGQGNALIMAGQKDSINYGDILEVTIDRLNSSGNIVATYQLQRDTTTFQKDPGLFNYPFQVFYKLNQPLDRNSRYHLKVKNTQTGLEATSSTEVLGDDNHRDSLLNPIPTARMNFVLPSTLPLEVAWAEGGKIYNLTLRIHYTETDNISGQTTSKYVDWKFTDVVINLDQPANIKHSIVRSEFFKLLGANIPVDANKTRQMGDPAFGGGLPIEAIITVGSEDLYRYMQLTAPSNSIVQDRPQFSNIQNGVGLFTGRSIKANNFRDLHAATISALDTSVYTKDLNFQ